jgi:hypothetical protein
MSDRYLAFAEAEFSQAAAWLMERPSRYIECAPRSREKDSPRGIALRDGAQRVSERKKFSHRAKFLEKRVALNRQIRTTTSK